MEVKRERGRREGNLVDAADTLALEDISSDLDSGLVGTWAAGFLVPGDLDGLHKGAKAHSGIGLGNAAAHAAKDAGSSGRKARGDEPGFNLACGKH